MNVDSDERGVSAGFALSLVFSGSAFLWLPRSYGAADFCLIVAGVLLVVSLVSVSHVGSDLCGWARELWAAHHDHDSPSPPKTPD